MKESRVQKQRDSIQLPPCPLPRPGDEVTWFQSARRETGVLTGHTGDAIPIVKGRFDREHRPRSFQAVRLVDPFRRKGPVWDDLPESALFSPTLREKQAFDNALSVTIPPGQTYLDLIEEIWNRGFEVFLVGGTVRDVVVGQVAHDVDLVTTMPLKLGLDVLRPMFQDNDLSVHPATGYCRIGGKPADGDPFIDLKMVCLDNLGTHNARFGADLTTDVAHRDFACNALFYDPKNELIIDPTLKGIADAEERRLTIVSDRTLKSDKEAAKIAIRYFKFLAKGFASYCDTSEILAREYIPELPALKNSEIIGYTRTQLLSKSNEAEWEEKFNDFGKAMVENGYSEEWEQYFEPRRSLILRR
jgi:Poly A polymerase head domain